MTENNTASGAADRVNAYLDRRSTLRGLDPDAIHGIDGEFNLTVSDLCALAASAPVAPTQPEMFQWPEMPPSKGQSLVLFEDGYAEGWARCNSDFRRAIQQATPEAAPVAPTPPKLKHVCNLWINPKNMQYEVDRLTHPNEELIPVYKIVGHDAAPPAQLGDGARYRCRKCGEQNSIEFNSARIVTRRPNGSARDPRDIQSDPEGKLMHSAGEPLRAAPVAPAPQPNGMPPTDDRQLYDPSDSSGYLESDNEWIQRNLTAVRWFIDNHAAIRALIAAAPKAAPVAPIAPDVAAELERSDWTPEEALRWYAAGRHYDTVPNGDGTRSARILDNGAVASNALKSLSREYAEHKGDVALLEQPTPPQQGEYLPLTQADIDRIVPELEPVNGARYPAEWALWNDRERIRAELSAHIAARGAAQAAPEPMRFRQLLTGQRFRFAHDGPVFLRDKTFFRTLPDGDNGRALPADMNAVVYPVVGDPSAAPAPVAEDAEDAARWQLLLFYAQDYPIDWAELIGRIDADLKKNGRRAQAAQPEGGA